MGKLFQVFISENEVMDELPRRMLVIAGNKAQAKGLALKYIKKEYTHRATHCQHCLGMGGCRSA